MGFDPAACVVISLAWPVFQTRAYSRARVSLGGCGAAHPASRAATAMWRALPAPSLLFEATPLATTLMSRAAGSPHQNPINATGSETRASPHPPAIEANPSPEAPVRGLRSPARTTSG